MVEKFIDQKSFDQKQKITVEIRTKNIKYN